MKKFLFLLTLMLSLCACSNTPEEPSTDLNSPDVESATIDETKTSCYTCGLTYAEGGYKVTASNTKIDLCKECRDELMLKNGFVVVNGEKTYPFSDVELYQDDIIAFDIPDDYILTDLEYDNGFWKAQLESTRIAGVAILIGWEDFFEGGEFGSPTIEERQNFSTQKMIESMGEEEYLSITAENSDPESYMEMDLQGETYYFYIVDNTLVTLETFKDGIHYVIASINLYENEEYDEYDLYLDPVLVALSLIYPTPEYLNDYFVY